MLQITGRLQAHCRHGLKTFTVETDLDSNPYINSKIRTFPSIHGFTIIHDLVCLKILNGNSVSYHVKNLGFTEYREDGKSGHDYYTYLHTGEEINEWLSQENH
jgi:hypothetical protein